MNSNKKSLAFCAADVEHEERANTNRLNADETNLLILRLYIVFFIQIMNWFWKKGVVCKIISIWPLLSLDMRGRKKCIFIDRIKLNLKKQTKSKLKWNLQQSPIAAGAGLSQV